MVAMSADVYLRDAATAVMEAYGPLLQALSCAEPDPVEVIASLTGARDSIAEAELNMLSTAALAGAPSSRSAVACGFSATTLRAELERLRTADAAARAEAS